jgi:hypothetical protein
MLNPEPLHWAPALQMRMAIGAVLIAFALYNWFRPNSAAAANAGVVADGTVGVVNGVVGGATGLAGLATVVWCNLRGWPPPEQRAVFQPVGVATFVMIALWLGGTGKIGTDTAWLFLLGLPALALGTWAGLKSFGHLNEAGFRKVVLGLLLLSGLALVIRGGNPLLKHAQAAEHASGGQQPNRVERVVVSRTMAAARLIATAGQLVSAARPITTPLAMISPTVTGARPVRTLRCQPASRKRSHSRNAAK